MGGCNSAIFDIPAGLCIIVWTVDYHPAEDEMASDWRKLPRKDPSKLRSKLLTLRVTERENKEIKKIAKATKRTITDVLVEGVLGTRTA